MIDWGLGRYERTAVDLEPAAAHAVAVAVLEPGERVLDLATGTGNAALIAARRGAVVTGLDAAERLIAVARERATETDADIDFRVGDLHSLPFNDCRFDVALSVFGLIFADHPETAFSEMMRVLQPGGRAVLSVWMPAGPIHAMNGLFIGAVARASGFTPSRFDWHDSRAVRALAAPHGAAVSFHAGELQFEADSPEAFLGTAEDHPMTVAGWPILERAGTAETTREGALAVLREGNEDPSRFRVTSPYRLIEIHRQTP